MKSIFTFLLLITTVISFGQEIFFVNAMNGLSCRVKPDLNSKKVGKLPYGATVELVTETPIELSVTDNDKIIHGNWIKIKYENFPYLVSNTNASFKQEAYVFDGYLEPLHKAKIEFEDLTKDQFEAYKTISLEDRAILDKITDLNKIKNLLKDKVTWISHNENREFITVDSLKLDNGQILIINQDSNDFSVTSYYAKEEILVFEGGHASDFSISTKTGESLTTVGNPEYILPSAYDNIRLNGSFPGQECSDYFFQEIKDGKLIYLTDFGWGSKNGDTVCNFKKFLWIRNKQFVYSYMEYSSDHEGGVEKYKKGRIIKNKK